MSSTLAEWQNSEAYTTAPDTPTSRSVFLLYPSSSSALA
jgi:hypothetical protein